MQLCAKYLSFILPMAAYLIFSIETTNITLYILFLWLKFFAFSIVEQMSSSLQTWIQLFWRRMVTVCSFTYSLMQAICNASCLVFHLAGSSFLLSHSLQCLLLGVIFFFLSLIELPSPSSI